MDNAILSAPSTKWLAPKTRNRSEPSRTVVYRRRRLLPNRRPKHRVPIVVLRQLVTPRLAEIRLHMMADDDLGHGLIHLMLGGRSSVELRTVDVLADTLDQSLHKSFHLHFIAKHPQNCFGFEMLLATFHNTHLHLCCSSHDYRIIKHLRFSLLTIFFYSGSPCL